MAKSSSLSSSSSSKKKQRLMPGDNTNTMKDPRVAAAEDEAYNQIARALLEEKGFALDDVNKICDIRGWGSATPMIYFSGEGDVKMCRYLLSRNADCRKTNSCGCSPMYVAACGGHLDVMQFLYHDGGAHEDVRTVTNCGWSPLRSAFDNGHFEVTKWLISNGALVPHNDVDGGGIDDAMMRRDIRLCRFWREDRRLPILTWAQNAVATHDHVVQLLVTGTIVRSNNQESSLLVTFKGTSGILELITRFVAGTQQQLRTRRQLMDRLSILINGTPFVEQDDSDDDSDDEWDY